MPYVNNYCEWVCASCDCWHVPVAAHDYMSHMAEEAVEEAARLADGQPLSLSQDAEPQSEVVLGTA